MRGTRLGRRRGRTGVYSTTDKLDLRGVVSVKPVSQPACILCQLIAATLSADKMIEEVENPYMHLKIEALNLLPEVMESSRREDRHR
jgi:glutamine synthetase type III